MIDRKGGSVPYMSGNVGQRIAADATGRGHDVAAIARNIVGRENGPDLHWVAGDLASPETLADILVDHDAIILSVRFQGLDFGKVLDVVRASGVPRHIVVGGAASLEIALGVASRYAGLP